MPFTGNVNKLVAAAILQDSFVDKDGTPMSAGTVTCYHDNSRTTLKNWYYQSGTPGNYTYITLPNPLTLSAAGTICDINGVDTIPFFYPWSETDENTPDPYYITIVNHAQTNQITRANFPFEGSGGGSNSGTTTFNNLVINSGFWRNIAPNTTTITPYTIFTYGVSNNMSVPASGPAYSTIVAPSQHDGFRMPDIQFIKNNLTATDKVTFTPFPLSTSQPINGNIVPEYYINHQTQSPGGSGETQKCYQFPISLHVNTLANVSFSLSIQAQNDPSSGIITGGGNVISIYILQDTGTGGTPVAVGPALKTITLNNTWTTYTASGIFPSTSGLILGNGADDGLYLQVQMPLNASAGCSINFTKPSIYLTENELVPVNDFQTYDQVDAIINSPRTGDVRTSLNSFYYFGWVPMNNGLIGNSLSNGSTRASIDAWPLFNLIWNSFKLFDTGANSNPIVTIFTSAGAPTNYGTSAISDWNANKAISLTSMLGRVMLGNVPFAALLSPNKTTFAASSGTGAKLLITAANPMNVYNGMPFYVTNSGGGLPGNLSINTIYYVSTMISNTQFYVTTSFANSMSSSGAFSTGGSSTNLIAFSSAGTGTQTIILSLSGMITGEYAHTQLIPELAGHTHTFTTYSVPGVSFPAAQSDGMTGAANAITDTSGSSIPFNVSQPGAFYNMFIKL